MGLTLEQKRAIAIAEAKAKARAKAQQASTKMGVGEDIARSAATGLGEGVTGTVGLLGDVQSLADSFGTWVGDKLGLPQLPPEVQAGFQAARAPTTVDIESATGFDQMKHTPQTTAGQYARTAGQFVPAMAAGGAVQAGPGVVRRLAGAATGTLAGTGAGLGSEAAGQMTEGTPLETPARLAGGIVGGMGANVLTRRMVTPRAVPPERAKMAQTLRKEGIDNLTEGQVTGNLGVQARERKASGLFWDQTTERTKQLEKLTQASLARAGVLARRATSDVMDDAFTKLGKQFDDLASRNTLAVDRQFGRDVATGLGDYMSLGPATEKVNALQSFIDRIGSVIDPRGNINGRAYQSLRSSIERAARGSMSDPEYASALRGLKDALDDAMERSMAAAKSPDLGAWRDVRKRWRNILVVDDAVGSTSATAAEGLITPEALRSAVKKKHGARNMVRGKGDFEELSRAAAGIMKDLPMTGTAPLNPKSVFESGLAFPLEMAARFFRDVRMTKPIQRYLTNTVAPPPPASPVRNYSPALIPPFTDWMRGDDPKAPR